MKIIIVGCGYSGLVTGACFSDLGIDVVCVDADTKKIEALNNGIMPIFEPGLKDMVLQNMKKGRLSFTTTIDSAISDAKILFIAADTLQGEDSKASLTYMLTVAHECGRHMDDYMLVVTKGTVPVGTAEKIKTIVQEELDQRHMDIHFDVASNPGFLREGTAVDDFFAPSRIVVGLENTGAKELMKNLYKPFVLNGHPLIFMDIVSAEMASMQQM